MSLDVMSLVAAVRSPAAEARSLHGRRSARVKADPPRRTLQESNLRLPKGTPDRETDAGDAGGPPLSDSLPRS
jgi:hypothetical protein